MIVSILSIVIEWLWTFYNAIKWFENTECSVIQYWNIFLLSKFPFTDTINLEDCRIWKRPSSFLSTTENHSFICSFVSEMTYSYFFYHSKCNYQLLVNKIYLPLGISIWLNVNYIQIVDLMTDFINFSRTNDWYDLASTITLYLQTKQLVSK